MQISKLRGRSALAVGVALALHGVTAFSQEESSSVTKLDEIVVTGSLIKGTPEDAAMPVEVIGEQELENLGRPSNLDLVKMMSEQGSAPGEANRFNGYPVGAATINLRNLGSRFTTVIFNGRRFPEQYAASVGRFNNINWIPNAAIGRIEVLKEGGAVTYGADAVGGVVNYITKKDLVGFVANVDYRYIKDSDGDYDADLSWGTKFDSGNFMVVGAYQHRSTLMAIDRPWSQTGFLENKTIFNWSGGGSPGSYVFQGPIFPGSSTYLTYGPSPFLPAAFQIGGDRQVSAGGTVRDPDCTALGGFAGWTSTPTPACYLQTAQFENLVEEMNQYQLYAEFNLKFGENTELHTEGLYYEMDLPNLANYPGDVPSIFGGVPSTSTGAPQTIFGFNSYYVPGQNPAVGTFLNNFRNSDGSLAFTPTQIAAITNNGRVGLQTGAALWRPFGNGGNPLVGRQDSQHNNTKMYRATAELKGNLPEFLGTQLEWSTALTYSHVDYAIHANDMLVDRLQAALNGLGGSSCTGSTPGANGCLWFNPFASAIERNVYTGQVNPNYVASLANSPDLIAWMRVPIELTRSYEYLWFDGLLSGDTSLKLPGGNVAVAVGVQGRYSSEKFVLDDLSDRNITPCATIGDTTCQSKTGPLVYGRNLSVLGIATVPPKRKYPVGAAFFEVKLPILDSLNAQIAGRYEKFYSDISDKDNSVFVPAAALKWQPLDWLAWRVSAGKTFSQVNPPVDDGPISLASSPTNNALGGISGYSTANYDNVDVQPMKSQYFSTGFVFEADNFSANVDYWYIKIDDYTRTMTANGVIDALRLDRSSAASSTDLLDCSSGLLSSPVGALGGKPFVELAAPCVQGTTTLGDIGPGTTINYFGTTNETNAGHQTSTGIDLSAQYRFDNVFGGTLTPSIDGTYNLKWVLGDFIIGGSKLADGYDGLGYKNGSTGRIGVPIPRWRGSFGLLYNHGKHTVNLLMTYIPGVVNENPSDFDASNDQNANIGDANGVVTSTAGATTTCNVAGSGLTSNLGNTPAGAGTGEFGSGSVGALGPRGFCGNQNVSILSGKKIDSSTNIDLTYRVELTDSISMSFTVYNLLDERPSFDRATVAYNSGFGSPLERNFKLGFQAKF